AAGGTGQAYEGLLDEVLGSVAVVDEQPGQADQRRSFLFEEGDDEGSRVDADADSPGREADRHALAGGPTGRRQRRRQKTDRPEHRRETGLDGVEGRGTGSEGGRQVRPSSQPGSDHAPDHAVPTSRRQNKTPA